MGELLFGRAKMVGGLVPAIVEFLVQVFLLHRFPLVLFSVRPASVVIWEGLSALMHDGGTEIRSPSSRPLSKRLEYSLSRGSESGVLRGGGSGMAKQTPWKVGLLAKRFLGASIAPRRGWPSSS